jgi:hypothetical protein
MFGRLGFIKGYYASAKDEVVRKMLGKYVGGQSDSVPAQQFVPESPVEYPPQKEYTPPLEAPGYELKELAIEESSEPVLQVQDNFLEREFLAESEMPNDMVQDEPIVEPFGAVELSAAEEISLAIEQAASGGVFEDSVFEGALEDCGFFDDVAVNAPGGLEEVLGDPFGDQEVLDGLEAQMQEHMAEEHMAEEQLMDDSMMGGFGGGGMM